MHNRIAILVDGGFFRKRVKTVYSEKYYATPEAAVKTMYTLAMSHANGHDLYKIFYYDCPPLTKKAHNPISNKLIDFGKSDLALYMKKYIEELKKRRKVVLRLGYLDEDNAKWMLNPALVKKVVNGTIPVSSLSDTDLKYDTSQKGVDMMVGVDIATLAYKHLVGKIVLISGDSDFVPAAKLARREGIDFILDSMWNPIKPDLHEHIDGLNAKSPRPPGFKK